MGEPSVSLIATEGPDDSKILIALLEKQGWERPKSSEESSRKGEHVELEKSGRRVIIVPASRRRGGRDYIPSWISLYWRMCDKFIVIFDPDERDYATALDEMWDRVWEKLNQDGKIAQYNRQKDGRSYWIQDGEGREALLIFWPAMGDLTVLSRYLSDPMAHNMLDYILVAGMEREVVRDLLVEAHDVRAEERVPPDRFLEKLEEIIGLLTKQGIQLRSSKRVMDFYRALLGFRGGFGDLGAAMIRALDDEQRLNHLFGRLPDFLKGVLED